MTDADRSAGDAWSVAALDGLVAVAARLAAAEHLAPQAGDTALSAIADAGVAGLRATAASIALFDPAGGALVFRAAAGPQGRGVLGVSIPPDAGIAGYVYSTGQAMAIADVATDPRFGRETAERTGYVPRSLMAVPLVDGEGILGVMEWLDRVDGEPFDLTDLEIATRVAVAATAVARATSLEHDAHYLLQRVLLGLAGPQSERPEAPDRDATEALVTEIATRLAAGDPLWRLADRIGQLRAADPDDVELAVDLLDALLASTHRRSRSGRRPRA